jgi:hypothetical protein
MADDDKWMTGPSRAQKDIAASLGLTVPARCGRARLARLIKQAQADLAPSAEQLDLAHYFCVQIMPDMTAGQLNERLLPLVIEHATGVMKTRPELRAGAVIRYEGLYYEIDFIGSVDGRHFVQLKPLNKTGDQNTREVTFKDIADAEVFDRDVAMALQPPARQLVRTH